MSMEHWIINNYCTQSNSILNEIVSAGLWLWTDEYEQYLCIYNLYLRSVIGLNALLFASTTLPHAHIAAHIHTGAAQ